MDGRLFDANKPLCEPMLVCYQFDCYQFQTNLKKIWINQNKGFSIQEDAFENVVCKMSAKIVSVSICWCGLTYTI